MENTSQEPNQWEQYPKMKTDSQMPEPNSSESHQGSTLMKEPNKKWLPVLLIIAVLVGGYFVFAKYQALWPFGSTEIVENLTPSPTPTPTTANWKTYWNEKYGFQFEYPDNFKIKELGDHDVGPNRFAPEFVASLVDIKGETDLALLMVGVYKGM